MKSCQSVESLFKTSEKSICKKCINTNEKCSLVFKSCGTDTKTGMSFVEKCSRYNKIFRDEEYNKSTITIAHSADTRIDSMGGGFHLMEKYKNGNA